MMTWVFLISCGGIEQFIAQFLSRYSKNRDKRSGTNDDWHEPLHTGTCIFTLDVLTFVVAQRFARAEKVRQRVECFPVWH